MKRTTHLARRGLLALALIGALSAIGCRQKQAWPPSPIAFVLGEDACDACRMTISDDRFGAQLHSPQAEEVQRFDDLGCLLAAHDRRTLDLQAVFVRSYDRPGWVRGDRAWIARSTELRSPMGFGLAAFSSEESARAEAGRHPDGASYRLIDLLSTPLAAANDTHLEGEP